MKRCAICKRKKFFVKKRVFIIDNTEAVTKDMYCRKCYKNTPNVIPYIKLAR